MLGLLRLWVLWRIARLLLPLVIALVLLGELTAPFTAVRRSPFRGRSRRSRRSFVTTTLV
jgi:hypothetical protein